MAVSLTTLTNEVMEQLNASPGTYGTLADPRRHAGEITDAILDADEQVCLAIIETPGHGQRKAFLTSAAVASEGQIPPHYGPIESVIFSITGGLYAGTRPGSPSDVDQLLIDNLNPNALTRIPPRFVVEGDTLKTNAAGLILGGASAVTTTVAYCTFVRTAACQSPDGLFLAVKAIALASLFGKEGHKTDAAQRWASDGRMALAMIRGGSAQAA